MAFAFQGHSKPLHNKFPSTRQPRRRGSLRGDYDSKNYLDGPSRSGSRTPKKSTATPPSSLTPRLARLDHGSKTRTPQKTGQPQTKLGSSSEKHQASSSSILPGGRPRSSSQGIAKPAPLFQASKRGSKTRRLPIQLSDAGGNYFSEPETAKNKPIILSSSREPTNPNAHKSEIIKLSDRERLLSQSLESPVKFFGEWSNIASPTNGAAKVTEEDVCKYLQDYARMDSKGNLNFLDEQNGKKHFWKESKSLDASDEEYNGFQKVAPAPGKGEKGVAASFRSGAAHDGPPPLPALLPGAPAAAALGLLSGGPPPQRRRRRRGGGGGGAGEETGSEGSDDASEGSAGSGGGGEGAGEEEEEGGEGERRRRRPGRRRRRPGGGGRQPRVCTYKFRGNLDLLRRALAALGWREDLAVTPRAKIIWSGNNLDNMRHGGVLDFHELGKNQKLSRFDGCRELCTKAVFSDIMSIMKRLFPGDEFSFYPNSWRLPQQQAACQRVLEEGERKGGKKKGGGGGGTYICKPDQGCEGMGITLVQRYADLPFHAIAESSQYVVQEYLGNPFLIDQLKFDLRLYVLVTSVDPLRCHLCKEGLVRFCTAPYEAPEKGNLRKAYAHLTNYGLNKGNAAGYRHTEAEAVGRGEFTGTKRPFSAVLGEIRRLGHDVEALWENVLDLVANTMMALQPYLALNYRRHFPRGRPCAAYAEALEEDDSGRCFQILGFDVMLDRGLAPHLLEVNSNPSLHVDHEEEVSPGVFEHVESPLDVLIKQKMMVGALQLVISKSPTPQHEDYEVVIGSDSEKLSSPLNMVDKIRILFQSFCGVRVEKGYMTSSQFRKFVMQVVGFGHGFERPDIDILYIRVCGSTKSPMELRHFLEALAQIADRVHPLAAGQQGGGTAAAALERLLAQAQRFLLPGGAGGSGGGEDGGGGEARARSNSGAGHTA